MEYYKKLRAHVGTDPLILPGANAIIIDDKNQVLLQQRLSGRWGLPGGLMELGESFEETAIREVKEETGLTIRNLEFMAVYSGHDHLVNVPNGDSFYAVPAIYIVRDYEGKMVMDETEMLDLQFYAFDALPENITERTKDYLNDYHKHINK